MRSRRTGRGKPFNGRAEPVWWAAFREQTFVARGLDRRGALMTSLFRAQHGPELFVSTGAEHDRQAQTEEARRHPFGKDRNA
jgi:hypothetical protein